MIEVVFNNSVRVALRIAKNYNKDDVLNGAIGYIGKAPTNDELEKMFEGQAIAGDPNDVICLNFNLDIGDISGEVDDEKRKKLNFEMSYNPFENNDTNLINFEKEWIKRLSDLKKFKSCVENGENIRIWWSDAPNETCGFYFANSILNNYSCNVTAIKLPKYRILSDESVAIYSSWQDIMSGKFYEFIPLQTEINKALHNTFAYEWEEQKIKNTSLRAVVNGKLMGVNEDFYDLLLRNYIPNNEFKVARLIGKVMTENQIGVSDWWYVQRIKKMIENKELTIVSEDDFYYETILKK
jgi:hypothetical protein